MINKVKTGSDQCEEKVICSAFARQYYKNRDSRRSHCQPGLPIILLCFTQNSTCDSWKGFPGPAVSTGTRQHTQNRLTHTRARQKTQRQRCEGREAIHGLDCALNKAPCSLCARRFPALSALPILPPHCGWEFASTESGVQPSSWTPALGREG